MPPKLSTGRIYLIALVFAGLAITARPVPAEQVLQRFPAKMGTPSLNLKDLEGREWTLDALRGKVVILNFWAGWCAPCIDELPYLNDLARNDAAKEKLVVLGVNFKESKPAIERFMSDHPVGYPILLDRTGEHFKKWAGGILPTTVIIDRTGRARWRVVGELDRNHAGFKKAIEKLLKDGEAAKANTQKTRH
ncbi:MAG: TlpA family protein disulfide reductase [Paucimonas sp.]|nr:TlpA family protein disulfide reductase [Paucimonas sp.]